MPPSAGAAIRTVELERLHERVVRLARLAPARGLLHVGAVRACKHPHFVRRCAHTNATRWRSPTQRAHQQQAKETFARTERHPPSPALGTADRAPSSPGPKRASEHSKSEQSTSPSRPGCANRQSTSTRTPAKAHCSRCTPGCRPDCRMQTWKTPRQPRARSVARTRAGHSQLVEARRHLCRDRRARCDERSDKKKGGRHYVCENRETPHPLPRQRSGAERHSSSEHRALRSSAAPVQ